MFEHQGMEGIRLPQQEACLTWATTINLGQHTLELLEEGGLLLIDNTTSKEVVQLDGEEQ